MNVRGWAKAGLLTLSGCAQTPEVYSERVGGSTLVISTAGANISTSRLADGNEILCVRLGPDAAFDSSFNVNVISVGRSEGENSAEEEVELTGRTPVNALIRDTLFHLCTLRQSQIITAGEYSELVRYVIKRGFELSSMEIERLTIEIQQGSAQAVSAVSPTQGYSAPFSVGGSTAVPPAITGARSTIFGASAGTYPPPPTAQ